MSEELILERYQVLDELGRGGSSRVYKAFDTHIERIVAIKEISAVSRTARRALREAKTTSLLNHPNIVTLYDFQESEGTYYLIMEYVEGLTLGEILAEGGSLIVDQSLAIAIQVALALECAHLNEVIHRDIKPDNLMLIGDGRIKVMDFGIARLKSGPASSITREGEIVGTLAYMSPEQVEGRYVDETTDVFSLGAVLYQMLTGASPFAAETPAAVIFKILHSTPRAPSELNPEVPPELDDVVLKALDRDPDERFETITEFRYKLERLQKTKASPQKLLKGLTSQVEPEEEFSEGAFKHLKTLVWQKITKRKEASNRVFGISLVALSLGAITRGFAFYPPSASIILLAVLAILMLSLPQASVGLLMILFFLPLLYRSLALGMVALFLFVGYWILFSRRKAVLSLIPVAAPFLNGLSLGFVYPVAVGLFLPPPLAAVLAGLGCLAVELYAVFSDTSASGVIQLEKNYHLFESLKGTQNLIVVLGKLAAPFIESPFLIGQIFIWAGVAFVVSLLARKRSAAKDVLAIILAVFLLVMSYSLLPARFGLKQLSTPSLMQFASISLIILLFLLVFLPYNYLKEKSVSGREERPK